MKKTLVLFLLLAVSLAAKAQKVTSASLQGSWSLESVTDGYVILYPNEHRGELTEYGKEGLSEEEIEDEKESLAISAEDYANTVMTFSGTTVKSVTAGEETLAATFTLNAAGTVLTITDSDGMSDEAEVSFEGKNLKVYAPADEATYIFKKKQ